MLLSVFQTLSQHYRDVCAPVLERCRFLFDEVQSSSNSFDDLRLSPTTPIARWRWAVRRLISMRSPNEPASASAAAVSSRRWSLVAHTLCDPQLRRLWQTRLGGRKPNVGLMEEISRFVLRKEDVNLEQVRQEAAAQRAVAQRRLGALNALVSQLSARRPLLPAIRNNLLFFWAAGAMGRRTRGNSTWR